MSKRHVYYAAALAEAKKRGFTAAQVRAATFAQFCGVMGFDASKVPEDFFYRNIRRRVANALESEARQAQIDALESDVRNGLSSLSNLGAIDIEKTDDGWLIRKA